MRVESSEFKMKGEMMKAFKVVTAVVLCPLSFVLLAAETPRNATLKTAGGPLIQAHRGSRGEFQDNGAGAFRWCVEKGIRGFETDVRFSKDHELVIMHDGSASRTTDGTGTIEKLTLAELKAMKLKNCSEPVPTFADICAALGGRDDIFLEIEMKAYPSAFYTPEVLSDYCRKLHDEAARLLKPGTYAFTCFDVTTLRTMRSVDAKAPLGYIMGGLTDEHLKTAAELDCVSVAPTLGTSKEMVDKAHRQGLTVCLWMVQDLEAWKTAKAKGADRVTSDYPHLLDCAVRGNRKRLVAMDLDATLCQHRSPVLWKNLKALEALGKRYRCVMIGAGNAPRIYNQMGEYPIDIVGNYGMQVTTVEKGKLTFVKAVTNEVDRAFFRRETDKLRAKYGYTKYEGEPLEFHASGMVTFGLLGTAPSAEHKVAFDPDKKKRRAMYGEVCEIFRDYSVYIGGSTSFDFAGKEYNKYDATLAWAKDHGYGLEDIVFIGDDFADGGGDSHVRIKGMDRIVINDYRNFAGAVSVLLK